MGVSEHLHDVVEAGRGRIISMQSACSPFMGVSEHLHDVIEAERAQVAAAVQAAGIAEGAAVGELVAVAVPERVPGSERRQPVPGLGSGLGLG